MDGDTETQLDDSRQNLDYLINVVYRPYIEEKVQVQQILSRINCIRPFATEIFSICSKNKKLALKILLDHLKNDVTDPGKYQEFKEALHQAGYKNIYEALEGGVVKNDFELIKIMGLFTQRIQETIDANKLAQELFSESVINEDMFQRVQTSYRTGSQLDAAFILLDSAHRLHPHWFHIFLKVLYRNGHRNLVNDLDDKYFKELNDNQGDSDGLMENVSQTREIGAHDDEDLSLTPAENSVRGDQNTIETRPAEFSRTPERLNSAASTENLTVVTAMVTLKENMEELLQVVRSIDAKIDRLNGKVEHLYSTLNIPIP